MAVLLGLIIGFLAWFFVRVVLFGVYTVDQNERAVKTSFGRAVRVPGNKTTLDDPIAEFLRPEEKAALHATRRCASSRPAGRISKCRGRRFTRFPSPL